MNKTTLFSKAKAALALGALALSGNIYAETVLRVGTWLAPSNPQNAVVWPTWAKWVEEATEGRVRVEVEEGLGHPKTLFQLVEDGVIDASFSYHGYVPGRFQLPQAVEQPGLGVSAEAASVALWRVYDQHFKQANEFDGLEVIGMFTHGPGYIHSKEPITSWDQIKGKKIRIGGGVQSVLGERMGITPVAAPAPKVYEMLQQGVIDGVFMPMGEQKALRLNEVAPNVTLLPGGMYLGSFSIFMNPDFLADLDPKDREAILSVSGEKLSQMAGKAWDGIDAEGYKVAQASGVNLIEVKETDPMAREFYAMIKGMKEEWVESVADRGIDAQAAVDELWSIARDYENGKQ
ncbi:TRAP-type C4-dicarboxylate transport system, periplasmic component [Marinobacterium lacunae]|uniref:TRAP-type C4-dicarboxylate transport system, periplasmic component n=1 Tax=Marinobacterium lacunae TaxID=1232683 RepID=A0A081FYN5_9GAMM|nr:TRAP transporter substrate-binding protein [Marinobacterium lacunae]KEA63640.1 TRAP-type C4-dicarboxylate transport system, periplasmic component [Marinobacterium lacunae]